MKKYRLLYALATALLAAAPAFAQSGAQPAPKPPQTQPQSQYKYPFQNPNLSPNARINNILSLMTLQEKINCLSVDTGVPRLGIPSFGGSEGLHGVVQRGDQRGDHPRITTTQFPQPPGMAATWDPPLVEEAGHVEGYEARFISQTPRYHRHILMLWGPQANLRRRSTLGPA